MFSKHTFGARHYGHRPLGYRKPEGVWAPPLSQKEFLEVQAWLKKARKGRKRSRVLVARRPVTIR
jgi:hypothetical protein